MSGNSASARLLGGVVRVATRHARATTGLALLVTVASLYYAANNLGINTDTADMISPNLPWRQDFTAYRESFPARDRNLVVVVDSAMGEVSQAYAAELTAALSEDERLFPTVFYTGSDFFERNGLLYLPLGELESLVDRLIEAQPLLGRLASDVSGAGTIRVLAESMSANAELSAEFISAIDPIYAEIAATLDASVSGERRAIAWGQLISPQMQPDPRQLVLIRPELDFSRLRPAREAIDRLHEIGAELDARYGGQADLRLTGALAMEHEELTSISLSATVAGSAAFVMVVIVLLWALRSPLLLLIAVLVLLSGLSLTAAFAAATVGRLNLLSVAFAVLYVGLGVDFILHLLLRLKELRARDIGLDDALLETGRGVGSSLVICAVTTAAGFFAFIPTDFDGVSELGLISGGGMIISLCVSLTVLPALIKLVAGRGTRSSGMSQSLPRIPWQLPTGATIGVAVVAAGVAILLLPRLEFDGNPIHLRDPNAESIRALNDLAADSRAPLFNLAVLVASPEAAEQVAVRLRSVESVKEARTVRSLVPSGQEEKLFAIEDIRLVMGTTLNGFEAQTPNPDTLIAELERLALGLGNRSGANTLQAELARAAASWLTHWRSLDPAAARVAAISLDHDILGNLPAQVARLRHALQAEPIGRSDLPPELLERWVNESGQEIVEVVPRDDLNDNQAAARFVAEVRSVAPNATGLPVVYQEAAATVTRAFSFALAYAFGIVSLLLLLFLRNVVDAVLVLVPILFAALLTAGASVAIGLPLNFANIIALPLLVGVGVDSGIHMVHRMRTEPPADGEPLHTSTSRAVFMSALTTIASFGNLAFSTHYGMASMGQLLTLGMVMSLVAVLGVLPSLIRMVERK